MKKLLEEQGKIFAETLHNSRSSTMRAGAYDVWRNQYELVNRGIVPHEVFKHMEQAFHKRLDELEPLIRQGAEQQ